MYIVSRSDDPTRLNVVHNPLFPVEGFFIYLLTSTK
uniref:Uncharacterized protein n=1 Tax=Staphylococcus phage 184DA TaxID=3110532 RepID=A0AAU6MXQ4_9CAUD